MGKRWRKLFTLSLEALLTFWGVGTLLFFLFRLIGDPAQMLMGQRSDITTLETLRQQLHLDRPLWEQYLYFWADACPLTFAEGKIQWRGWQLGFSYQSGKPVSHMYQKAFKATAILALSAWSIALLTALTLGLWQAYFPSPWIDRATLFLLAFPGYVAGLVMLGFFGILLGWLPLGGYVWEYNPTLQAYEWQGERLILPTLALALRPAAILTRQVAAYAHNVLQQDFIRTAWAKGKTPWAILWQDVLRTILPPLLMSLSQWLAGLLAGTFFVEVLFQWPGLGKLMVQALYTADYPVIVGISWMAVGIFVLLNAVSEMATLLVDPRLRDL
ncbi:MAG: ABC transporter permease [Bacteroidia bacterium]